MFNSQSYTKWLEKLKKLPLIILIGNIIQYSAEIVDHKFRDRQNQDLVIELLQLLQKTLLNAELINRSNPLYEFREWQKKIETTVTAVFGLCLVMASELSKKIIGYYFCYSCEF